MYATQSNTQPGERVFVAASDLTGKQGYLCALSSSSGTPVVDLPAALTTRVIGLIVDDAASGGQVTVAPLSPMTNRRVVAKGTGSAGDLLSLADPTTAADKGKLRKQPTTTGTWIGLAIAEEDFVDGQLVLVRPYGPVSTTI